MKPSMLLAATLGSPGLLKRNVESADNLRFWRSWSLWGHQCFRCPSLQDDRRCGERALRADHARRGQKNLSLRDIRQRGLLGRHAAAA